MMCLHCHRDMTRCICPDADERIASLKTSPYLDPGMLERIEAGRLLAKFEIEADRKATPAPAKEKARENTTRFRDAFEAMQFNYENTPPANHRPNP
jgi:hypothetical protein